MNEREIFQGALDHSDPAERAVYLDRVCGADAALRERIEGLLLSHASASQFLDVPAMEQVHPPSGGRPRRTADLSQTSAANGPGGGDSPEDDSQAAPDLSFLQPPSQPGSIGTLGHYRIVQLLGQGAFGLVFKAFDEKLHRHVAIKVLNPQLAATSPPRKRFLREARSAAAIKHENVVQVYSVEEQPLPYLVMEYVDGQTLKQKLDGSGPLDVADILHLGRQMASGLAAAHAQGLIHRDIKPGNILIETGAEQKVKITDFGLARAADDATMTRTGVISGTPMYMAPEQAQGLTLDHRTDLFSLGSVLYQMASGRPPFRGASAMAVLKRVTDEPPRPIQEILPEVPDWLCAIIARLHAKKPEDRFQSAKDVADLLGRCQTSWQQHSRVELPADVAPFLPKAPAAPKPQPVRKETPPNKETAAPIPRAPRRQRWAAAAAVLVALFAGLSLTEATGVTNFRGTIIRLFAPDGTLVVEVDDPGVSVSIDGEEMVITGTGAKEIRLKPGQHQVLTSKDGKVMREELVTITRSGREVVRVSKEPGPVAARVNPSQSSAPGTPIAEQRKALESVLSHGGRIVLIVDGKFQEFRGQADQLPNQPLRVQTLDLSQSGTIDDRNVENLKGLPAVEFLLILGPGINDGAFAKLATYPGIVTATSLNLSRSAITNEGFVHVRRFTRLRHLSLTRTGVSAEGLEHLQDQPITELFLYDCGQIKDDACAVLARMPGLIELRLGGSPVTDAGLTKLAACEVLKSLDVRRCPVTDEGIQKLATALPQCQIEWDKGSTDVRTGSPPRYTNSLGMEFALVPRGKAWLGGGGGKPGDREIEFKEDFYLGVYEVTQEEWEKIMGATPSKFSRRVEPNAVKDISDDDLKRFPVESVSWDDAQGFLEALNQREKEVGWVYRLPTLDEWEYACRGGPASLKLDSAFRFYVSKPSNELQPNEANFNAKRTCKVGSYQPNRLGLYDMHGNVAEWCHDAKTAADGSLHRTERGGGYLQPFWTMPTARFHVGPPQHRGNDLGLRVARVRVAADPDHRAAEWVLSIGGTVRVNSQEQDIKTVAELPKANFRLTAVDLRNYQKITEEGLTLFRDCRNVSFLGLVGPGVTDAGLANFRNCKDLTFLSLAWAPVTDGGLMHFKGCEKLTDLDLYDLPVTDAGLANFKDCRDLATLRLDGTRVTDAGLANFKDCSKLYKLLLNKTQVTDAGLANFKDCKNFGWIHLADTQVTATGLAHFTDCKSPYFDLRGTQMDDAGLKKLAGITTLRGVNLRMTKVTVAGIDALKKALPQCVIEGDGRVIDPKKASDPDRRAAEWVLSVAGTVRVNGQELDIHAVGSLPKEKFVLTMLRLARGDQQLTDEGLAHLKDCKSLRALWLAGPLVTDQQLTHFQGCKDLTFLKLPSTSVTDAGLASFKDCKYLTNLDLTHTEVTDAGLVHFKDCKKLIVLNLADTRVTDTGLAHFQGCKDLISLGLQGTRVTGTGLVHFKDWLTGLDLARTEVTDAELAIVKDCENLTHLVLDRCTRVTDRGLAHVGKLSRLTWLELNETGLTDAGMSHLGQLKKLVAVNLTGTKVTDAGLVHFKELPYLEGITLMDTQVGDACLDLIAGWAKLKHVRLQGTKVTAVGVARLAGKLPRCRIEWNGGLIEPK